MIIFRKHIFCLSESMSRYPWRHSMSGWMALRATWLSCRCTLQGNWTRWLFRVPSDSDDSMISSNTEILAAPSAEWKHPICRHPFFYSLSVTADTQYILHISAASLWGLTISYPLSNNQPTTSTFELLWANRFHLLSLRAKTCTYKNNNTHAPKKKKKKVQHSIYLSGLRYFTQTSDMAFIQAPGMMLVN